MKGDTDQGTKTDRPPTDICMGTGSGVNKLPHMSKGEFLTSASLVAQAQGHVQKNASTAGALAR
eukprot:1145510-Pelagomonas_calceolata.AAC.11